MSTHKALDQGLNLTHGISRKLEGICRSLTLPAEEGQALEFLTNIENTQRINDLVEDVYEVLMEYWVCVSNDLSCTMSDIHVRLQYKKTSTKRVVDSL